MRLKVLIKSQLSMQKLNEYLKTEDGKKIARVGKRKKGQFLKRSDLDYLEWWNPLEGTLAILSEKQIIC